MLHPKHGHQEKAASNEVGRFGSQNTGQVWLFPSVVHVCSQPIPQEHSTAMRASRVLLAFTVLVFAASMTHVQAGAFDTDGDGIGDE
jgi:hypothetical protein